MLASTLYCLRRLVDSLCDAEPSRACTATASYPLNVLVRQSCVYMSALASARTLHISVMLPPVFSLFMLFVDDCVCVRALLRPRTRRNTRTLAKSLRCRAQAAWLRSALLSPAPLGSARLDSALPCIPSCTRTNTSTWRWHLFIYFFFFFTCTFMPVILITKGFALRGSLDFCHAVYGIEDAKKFSLRCKGRSRMN